MEFAREKHVQYFLYHLRSLPAPYGSLDSSRMTVLYFVCSGLDVLGALDQIKPAKRAAIVEWVYAQQVVRAAGSDDVSRCGFRGSPYLGAAFGGCDDCSGGCAGASIDGATSSAAQTKGSPPVHELDDAHITMTYTALCILKILGDPLVRFRRADTIAALRGLQEADGSFRSVRGGGERDMRFIFCAFAISSMLGDWSGVDADRAIAYVLRSQAYDGAFGLGPHGEGHGGSTYCAVACLALANRLDALDAELGVGAEEMNSFGGIPLPVVGALDAVAPSSAAASAGNSRRNALLRWCAGRQFGGFCGRPNKPADTCYSFWIGATLQMLGAYETVAGARANAVSNRAFNLTCQGKVGGFSKVAGASADILHSYMGLCGLRLIGLDADAMPHALNVSWGITQRASSDNSASAAMATADSAASAAVAADL